MVMPWIVCLGGEDWWYHSHAHFDIQVMKRLAVRCPVLYICSTGMRVPSISRDTLFWSRIRRKAASVAKGLRRIHAQLYVYSPLSVPAYEYSFGRSLNRALLTAQFGLVFARLGIRRPLIWVNTPTAWSAVQGFRRRAVVYQRTDDYVAYTLDNFNADYVREIDDELLRTSDLVLHVSDYLHDRDGKRSANALLLEQGVDERFLEEPVKYTPPPGLASLPRPVIGYVGNMEPYKFDAELVGATAAGLPEYSFALVGPHSQNAERLRELKNVHFLGRKEHDEIPAYVRSFDVCMLPTAKTEWGLKCKPIKLMEYLAADRPVVSTDTPATAKFREFLHIGDTPTAWVRSIREILSGENRPVGRARARMRECTWDQQVNRIWSALEARGLVSGRTLN